MDRRKLDKAAEDLAAILETHLNSLPADERKIKRAALESAVSKIRTRRANPVRDKKPPKTEVW